MYTAPKELTTKQKSEIHALLKAKEKELVVSIEQYAENSAPVAPDASLGRLTRLDAMQQQHMAKAQLAKARQSLAKIQRLLDEWDDELVGICRSCEDPIGYGRLKRVPDSLVCMQCLEDAL